MTEPSDSHLENFKDSFVKVLARQRLGMRAVWLGMYYVFGNIFPRAPLPGSGLGTAFRSACARRIFCRMGRDVTVHSNVSFGSGVNVEIGDYSSLNYSCSISNDTVIGRDVMMGPEVLILSGSHNFARTDISMREQGAPPRRPVTIGDDVWIGARSVLLPGVTIGSHAIVGAGSVVTRNVPEHAIVGGNPARVIRFRTDSGNS